MPSVARFQNDIWLVGLLAVGEKRVDERKRRSGSRLACLVCESGQGKSIAEGNKGSAGRSREKGGHGRRDEDDKRVRERALCDHDVMALSHSRCLPASSSACATGAGGESAVRSWMEAGEDMFAMLSMQGERVYDR